MVRSLESGRACLLVLAEPKSIRSIWCYFQHSSYHRPYWWTAFLPWVGSRYPQVFLCFIFIIIILLTKKKNKTWILLSVWKINAIGTICKQSDPCPRWIYNIESQQRMGDLIKHIPSEWHCSDFLEGAGSQDNWILGGKTGKPVSYHSIICHFCWPVYFTQLPFGCSERGQKKTFLVEAHQESYCRSDQNVSE